MHNSSATMNDHEFQHLNAIIHDKVGIRLSPAEKGMLQACLPQRLKSLGLATFEVYGDFVCSPEGRDAELPYLIDAVTV